MSQTRLGIKMNVLLFYPSELFIRYQHAAAIVTDLSTGRKFDVNYVYDKELKIYSREEQTPLEAKCQKSDYKYTTVTIYSHGEEAQFERDFDDFVKAYKAEFSGYHYNGSRKEIKQYFHWYRNEGSGFNLLYHNCSNAVKMAMDYFFIEKTAIDRFCCVYKAACCFFIFPTCGVQCFPTPPTIWSPREILNLAKMLSNGKYGDQPELTILKKQIDSDESYCSDADSPAASRVMTGSGLHRRRNN
jgi:hypothetical protein